MYVNNHNITEQNTAEQKEWLSFEQFWPQMSRETSGNITTVTMSHTAKFTKMLFVHN